MCAVCGKPWCDGDGPPRDWWSRRNCGSDVVNSRAVSSVGVSSTGWQSSNHLWASVSVSSEFSTLSTGELYNQQSFQELQDFSDSFTAPLIQAKDCMRPVDDALVECVEHVVAEAVEMINSAANITTRIYQMAHQCWEWLPSLTEASPGPITEVHEILKSLRKDAQSIRAVYINLLDKVGYVGQCAEVTMDESAMYYLMAPEQDSDGNYIDKPQQPLTNNQKQQHLENSLRMALVHLDRACSVLEDCPEFWLLLHKAELALSTLEKKASKLVGLYFHPSGSRAELLGFFARELGDFCQGHMLGNNSHLKGGTRTGRSGVSGW